MNQQYYLFDYNNLVSFWSLSWNYVTAITPSNVQMLCQCHLLSSWLIQICAIFSVESVLIFYFTLSTKDAIKTIAQQIQLTLITIFLESCEHQRFAEWGSSDDLGTSGRPDVPVEWDQNCRVPGWHLSTTGHLSTVEGRTRWSVVPSEDKRICFQDW